MVYGTLQPCPINSWEEPPPGSDGFGKKVVKCYVAGTLVIFF